MSLKTFGQPELSAVDQIKRCLAGEPGSRGVLCADNHKGYSMPIGGVVGYRDHVSPSGVGYDIACGNMAVRTPLLARDLSSNDYSRLADEIRTRLSFGVGRKNNERVDSPVFDAIAQSPVLWQRAMLELARAQLGTVGSGNHYVDVLEDEAGRVWIANHFGSRGFGHKTASGFMNIAQGRAFNEGKGGGEMDSPPLLLGIRTAAGQDYIRAMEIAGAYAYAGREAVIARVLEILGTTADFAVHNHHNFAWRETHGGEEFWVVRKGATPAFPGQWGFVGGSMGDISVVLRGVVSTEAEAALYSTMHGAGRVMSRTQAAGKRRWGKARSAGGAVNFEAEKQKLEARGIVLRGAGADEAPPVYRPLQSVLDAHAGTIEVVHTLQPRVVVMAGAEEFDPYKD
jgi:tRNA-splicing ligase RtcB